MALAFFSSVWDIPYVQMSEPQRTELDALIGPDAYDGSVSARAQMVLWNDAGLSVQDIARRSGASKPTVYKWLDRYQRFGVDGLADPSACGTTARSSRESAGSDCCVDAVHAADRHWYESLVES